MADSVLRSPRFSWIIALVPLLLLTGCGAGGDDGIKTYKVAKPDGVKGGGGGDTPNGANPPVPDGPAKVRLLGAIIPEGADGSYFVKFVGPIEQVNANEKDFDAFLNSIRVPGEGGKPISYTVPAGWSEAPARQMRVITLKKTEGTAPDLYVSTPFGGSLLENVNRWRTGDAGIAPVSEAELKDSLKEVQLGGTNAFRVDLRGPGGKGMAKGPFMGGGK